MILKLYKLYSNFLESNLRDKQIRKAKEQVVEAATHWACWFPTYDKWVEAERTLLDAIENLKDLEKNNE